MSEPPSFAELMNALAAAELAINPLGGRLTDSDSPSSI
jgi:hypothetical protein